MTQAMAIVLAAGKGTRMNSELPKVLCQANGRPLIDYVMDAVENAKITRSVVVVGYEAEQVKAALADRKNVEFVHQTEQKGTGHAVQMAQEHISQHSGPVLILAGDSPMVRAESLAAVLNEYSQSQPACVLGTLLKDDPHGLGRIVRNVDGEFECIVEEKDATDEQRAISEVNMSTYVFDSNELLHALGQIDTENSQGELYLTDCPGILKQEGKLVIAAPVLHPSEALSVNTTEQLAEVESAMKARNAE